MHLVGLWNLQKKCLEIASNCRGLLICTLPLNRLYSFLSLKPNTTVQLSLSKTEHDCTAFSLWNYMGLPTSHLQNFTRHVSSCSNHTDGLKAQPLRACFHGTTYLPCLMYIHLHEVQPSLADHPLEQSNASGSWEKAYQSGHILILHRTVITCPYDVQLVLGSISSPMHHPTQTRMISSIDRATWATWYV
jgi:hypothetical protein